VDFNKGFKGEGEYKRTDEFTARLSAEVIEILPNGNLVVESRTEIKNDDEVSTVTATGICRPEDISPVNTILSTQLHDLRIEKVNTGPLKDANSKGIFTEILDFLFAF
jgi:flagellar L-ring protein precursor FlgH